MSVKELLSKKQKSKGVMEHKAHFSTLNG